MNVTWKQRLLAMMLAVCTILSLGIPAQASSVADGSKTCTVTTDTRCVILTSTAGTALGATAYKYSTNDGLTGTAYCIDHGLRNATGVLPITGAYSASPATAGAFANGYPQHDIQTFLGLHQTDYPILSGLTEDEYKYATQIAVWATLGQL